MRMKLNFTQT